MLIGGFKMKWDKSTIDQFVQNQMYFDTAIVPCVQVQLGEQLINSVTDATWVSNITHALEGQLTGRVMLFPFYSYTGLEGEESILHNLNTYRDMLVQNGFTYVFFITVDPFFEDLEDRIQANILYVYQKAEDKEDLSPLVTQQYTEQIMKKLIKSWKNG